MDIARALVDGPTDRDAVARDAAAFGLAAEFPEESPVEVWPEHWLGLQTILAMGTQLNVGGMGAVIGYRYEVLPVVWEVLGVAPSDRAEAFEAFRGLESETLRLMRERMARQHGGH